MNGNRKNPWRKNPWRKKRWSTDAIPRPALGRRQVRPLTLAVTLLLIVLQKPSPAATQPEASLQARRGAILKGNLLENGGFEAGDRGWTLENARVTSRKPYAGLRALALSPAAGKAARATVDIPVVPGLISLSAAVRFAVVVDPGVAAPLQVQVTWLDEAKKPIPAGGRTPKEQMDQKATRLLPPLIPADAGATEWRRAVLVSSYEDPSADEAPASAAFARVVFEFSGPDSAFIDDVRVTYSRRNFTLTERLAPYRDLDDDALGRVIPTPKALEERGPAIEMPYLCLSLPSTLPKGLADRLPVFEESVRKLGSSLIRLSNSDDGNHDCDLTIIVTTADQKSKGWIKKAAREAKRLGPDGYVLETHIDALNRPAIVAAGADARGSVYALETLRQLLRPSGKRNAALRAVTARDWPTFKGRSLAAWENTPTGIKGILRASHWITGVKLNRLYLNYTIRTARWWEPPIAYKKLLVKLGERARGTGLYELGILLNPYAHRNLRGVTDTFQISRKEDVDILWSQIAESLDAGARIVMLCMDDFTPSRDTGRHDYALTDSDDQKTFSSLANAHVALVKDLRRRSEARDDHLTLMFVPPWYNEKFRESGGPLANTYLGRLGPALPKDVGIAWTGPTVRSRIVDGVSFGRFSAAVGGRRLIFWDNSMWELELSPLYAGSPERARLVSLFEPYAIESDNLLDTTFDGEFYFNSSSGGRYVAKAMTLAEYLWNPDAYDPDRSIWRAMISLWGRETASLLIDWDAAYWNERLWINRLMEARGKTRTSVLASLSGARKTSSERWKTLKAALGEQDNDLIADLEVWVKEQAARDARARGDLTE